LETHSNHGQFLCTDPKAPYYQLTFEINPSVCCFILR